MPNDILFQELLVYFLGLLITGVVGGLIAGLFGVGGGIVIVPILFWIFTSLNFPNEILMHMAIGSSLATIIPTSISSARAHYLIGSALAHYGGFKERGFGVVALFDDDPKKINKQIAGLVVKPTSELNEVCKKYNVAIGIIATPGKFAQSVADEVISCDLRSILNFAPVSLKNTSDVQIRSVDLSQELQILSYYLDRPVLKAVK